MGGRVALEHVQKADPQLAHAKPGEAVELVVQVVVDIVRDDGLIQRGPTEDVPAVGAEDPALGHPETIAGIVGISPPAAGGQLGVAFAGAHGGGPGVQVVLTGQRVRVQDDHIPQRAFADMAEADRPVVGMPGTAIRRVDGANTGVFDIGHLVPEDALVALCRIRFERIVDDGKRVHLSERLIAKADIGFAAIHATVVELRLRPSQTVVRLRVQHAVATGVVDARVDGPERFPSRLQRARVVEPGVLIPALVAPLLFVVAHVPAVGAKVGRDLPRPVLADEGVASVAPRLVHGPGNEVDHLDHVVVEKQLWLLADVDR